MKPATRTAKKPLGAVADNRTGESVNSTSNRSWRKMIAAIFVLICLTLTTFLPALNNQFIDFDDDLYVTANPHVHAGLTWNGVAWAFSSMQVNNWHPLTWLSHMLDWQL